MNNILRIAAPIFAAGALASFVFIGCSSDDSSSGGDPTVVDSGTTPRDTEVPTTETSTDDTGTAPTDSGSASDGGDTGTWSLDSGVCFPGKPTKMVEYLNKCTTSDSVKFTKKLTKLNADGSRPALP
ncbi:MAG: hypothetical protein ACXVEF_06385 [Polyangiales bacterium]